jgi:photosystem II stability/assembly factor-like uncharacterized protein
MRFKFTFLTLIVASLACTANVSVLNPTTATPQQIIPSEVPQSTPPVSVPPLEGLPIVVPGEITHIDMLDAQNGWMITNKFVLRTMDGGATWHDVTPSDASVLGFGVGAAFLDSDRGWVLIGDPNDTINAGVLYKTQDGGIQWRPNPVPFGGGELHFLDDSNGWLMLPVDVGAGNMAVQFYQTTDGGTNWTQVYSNLRSDADFNDSLPYSGIKSGFTPVSMQEAWVTGASYADNVFYVYHTTDSGHTWKMSDYQLPFTGQAMYQIQPPRFFDSRTAILPMTAGSEGMSTLFLKTQDSGMTWTPGTVVPGSGHYSIASVNDVFVWFGGELSVSHDSGQTWNKLTASPDLSADLIQLQFVDAQTGWAITSDANNHTSLYKSTDGGQTWSALV